MKISSIILAVLSSVLLINSNYATIKDPAERKLSPNTKEISLKKKLKNLKEFEPSIKEADNLSSFQYHQRVYLIETDIQTAWSAYVNVAPTISWKGPLNTYRQSYSTSKNTSYTPKDTLFPNAELGMVYELNIKVAKLRNIGVTFQITELDNKNMIIEFTYGKDNKSHGKQQIEFKSDGAHTLITHSTYFKSNSKFRDKHLYPKFHERCLDEYHNNIMSIATKQKQSEK
jgi:hypothetical protein